MDVDGWMCMWCLRGNSSLLINEFTNLIIETCSSIMLVVQPGLGCA